MHFQDSLPKLPIPTLESTLANFLYSATPLVTAAELGEARALCADFATNEGPRLQQALVDADAKVYSSYISKPWFDLYLRDRAPLLLNHNPQLTWIPDPRNPSQPQRAARLVHGAVTFLRTLESNALQPDVFHTDPARSKHPLWAEAMRLLPRSVAFYGAAACGAYPLDMSQYDNLFRSTRVPRQEKGKRLHPLPTFLVVAPNFPICHTPLFFHFCDPDELKTNGASRHIVVQRGGGFWALDVIDERGKHVPPPPPPRPSPPPALTPLPPTLSPPR